MTRASSDARRMAQCLGAVALILILLATTLAPVLAEGRPWRDSHRPTSIGAMAHHAPATAPRLVDPPARTVLLLGAAATLLAMALAGSIDRRGARRRGRWRRMDAAFVDDQQRGPPQPALA